MTKRIVRNPVNYVAGALGDLWSPSVCVVYAFSITSIIDIYGDAWHWQTSFKKYNYWSQLLQARVNDIGGVRSNRIIQPGPF